MSCKIRGISTVYDVFYLHYDAQKVMIYTVYTPVFISLKMTILLPYIRVALITVKCCSKFSPVLP